MFEAPCQELDQETNLCKLHNTDKKPRFCTNFNSKKKGKYYIPEGCIYK